VPHPFHVLYEMGGKPRNQLYSNTENALTRMTTEDIRSRQWSDAEKQAIRRASGARAAGLDLPEKE
jgi:hypothetical protein